jgi:putative membrane protein
VGLAILAVIAGIVNGLIKPIVKLFSLPLTVMTLGLFGLVINAGMLLLIAWLSDLVGLTFTVGGFPPDLSIDALVAALIGGIAITIVGSIVGLVVHD